MCGRTDETACTKVGSKNQCASQGVETQTVFHASYILKVSFNCSFLFVVKRQVNDHPLHVEVSIGYAQFLHLSIYVFG